MDRRQKIYIALLGLSLFWALAAITSAIPWSSASKANVLGYRSLCSFAPFSTLMCAIFAAMICIYRKNRFLLLEKPPIKFKLILLAALSIVTFIGGGLITGYISV